MKRLAFALVILMLGILPAAAESTSTEPIRGAKLDAMVREILEWIIRNTEEYLPSGSPRIIFVDTFDPVIAEYELKRKGSVDADYEFHGLYNSNSKTGYLRDDWSGHSPNDWFTLAHELVHYAQDGADKKFECHEDKGLEADVVSAYFLNDRFGDRWLEIVSQLIAARKKQATCTRR